MFFADEPILRIVAPLREAQLVESRLMNLVHYADAGREQGRALGARGARTGCWSISACAARTAPRRGCCRRARATSPGSPARRRSRPARDSAFPLFGTMAHSYVQAHADETPAFECFARAQPDNAVLLIDTYDTERAAHKVVALAPQLARRRASRIKGVRIDSGDLGEHARRVRAILDDGGLPGVTIFASGNLDEYRLRELVAQRAPIDGFGVGTRMNTSADAPYLDCAYKLEEYDGRPRRKRSEGKATWPGRKQVWRRYDGQGRLAGDVLTLESDVAPGGAVPLLAPVMRKRRGSARTDPLRDAREHARAELARLPDALRALDEAPSYQVEIAPALRALAAEIDAADLTSLPARWKSCAAFHTIRNAITVRTKRRDMDPNRKSASFTSTAPDLERPKPAMTDSGGRRARVICPPTMEETAAETGRASRPRTRLHAQDCLWLVGGLFPPNLVDRRGNHERQLRGAARRSVADDDVLRRGAAPSAAAAADVPADPGEDPGQRQGASGATVECSYSRGSLRKRITVLERPRLVRFEVIEQNLGVERCVTTVEGSYEIRSNGGGSEVALTTKYRGHLRPRWLWRPLERLLAHRLHRHILAGMGANRARDRASRRRAAIS